MDLGFIFFLAFLLVPHNSYLRTNDFYASLNITTFNSNLMPTCQLEKVTSAYRRGSAWKPS